MSRLGIDSVSRNFWVVLLLAGLAVAYTGEALGQEQSVKPGINDRFKDNPSVEFFLKTFETESRAIYKHRNDIVAAAELKPGMDVADIGAGTGFFSAMMAARVGPKGKVYAVDIAENFLEHIAKTAKEAKIKNIKTVLCDDRSTKLKKDSVDFVFVCDTYHHFEFPFSTLESIHNALRPGGRLFIVDFERVKGRSTDWILGHVRCGKGTVTDEVKDAGFEFVKEIPMMKEQYIRVFQKRG